MDEIISYLSTHQPVLIFATVIALCIIYFLFTKLLKMALLFTIVLLALGGFLYLKNPQKMSESVKQTVGEAKTKTGKIIDTGKQAFRDAMDLFDKGKKLPGQIDRLIMGKEEQSKEQSK